MIWEDPVEINYCRNVGADQVEDRNEVTPVFLTFYFRIARAKRSGAALSMRKFEKVESRWLSVEVLLLANPSALNN
jgi:hypothetical protein